MIISETVVTIALFVLGLILIIIGGDKFVDAAIAIAKKLGISEIIIGATIVSLGTTLPEVLVSTTAAFSGSADIAAGNAFGSIICNTTFIAGLTQLIKPAKRVNGKAMLWRTFFFFAAISICLIFGLITGRFGTASGIVLIGMFILYAILNIKIKDTGVSENEDEPEDTSGRKLYVHIIILVVTAAMLYFGARLLVDNGIVLAEAIGVPERVIGVTFIALGTSLPELVTAITSMIKGHGAVSVGNILGANILNCVLVIGIPAAITGVNPSMSSITFDIPVAMLVMALLTIPMIIRNKGSRIQGGLLLASYAAYCIYLF